MSGDRRRRGRGIGLLAVILLLAAGLGACAAPQVAYKRLDWLASWKLGQYVDLTATQEKRFDADFKQLWDWHRSNELVAYGRDLRELAQVTQQPMSAEAVRAWADRAQEHSHKVMERAGPSTCELMASFDDAQRDSVLKRVDEDIAEDVEEYLEPSIETQRKDARKRIRKTLVRWVGHLEPAQEEMVEHWSQHRPQRYVEWIAERRRWRDRFAATLEQRSSPAFCDSLKSLLVEPDAKDREGHDADLVNADNAQNWFSFLAAFSATLDEKQREVLRGKLLELATDFEAMKT